MGAQSLNGGTGPIAPPAGDGHCCSSCTSCSWWIALTFNATPNERFQQHSPFSHWTAPITHSFCEDCTWHHLHILVTAPLCCDWKDWAASVQSFTLWQQATTEITRSAHSISACSRHLYMGVVLRIVSASLHTPQLGGPRFHRAHNSIPSPLNQPPKKASNPILKNEALEISEVGGPFERKVLIHCSYFGPIWKQNIYTLQLVLGAPLKAK